MTDLDLAQIRQRLHDLAFAVPGIEAIDLTIAVANDVPALVADAQPLHLGVDTTRSVLEWVAEEYRRCIVSARCTHSAVQYAQVNGRAEAYRQLASRVTQATGVPCPDWEQIKRDVPADGTYATTTRKEGA